MHAHSHHWLAAVLLAVAGFAAACGDGDGGAQVTDPFPSTTGGGDAAAAGGLSTCEEDRHAVVVDVGSLTTSDEVRDWIADVADEPDVRPGAVEMLLRYRDLGYDAVYMTGLPVDTTLGGTTPMTAALQTWLTHAGFPTGDGNVIKVWDPALITDVNIFKTQTMVELATTGVALDFGYTDDDQDIQAYLNAGIPADQIYTSGDAAGLRGTTAITGGDWRSHVLTTLQDLEPVCQR